jgi:23S rRNA (adenine2503-C2)-methyltransferase
MLKEMQSKCFENGHVYLLHTEDSLPIETTFTWLPAYTKDAINGNTNKLYDKSVGSWNERAFIGVSVMSGCPVRCKFCATGKIKRWRNLTAQEIVEQIDFILAKHPDFDPFDTKEFKINFTRMGEPFLNIENVKQAIFMLQDRFPNVHCYISTIGIKGANFDWIKDNVTLQISLHSLDDERRNWLIPYGAKLKIEGLGQIRVNSKLKTTVNLTLVDENDFDIEKLKANFDPKAFFIKVSPVNPNEISEANDLGEGIIKAVNLV